MKNVLVGDTIIDRESSITFLDLGFESIDKDGIHYADSHTPDWYPIGEDNDEITRERNDSIDGKKNVLGHTIFTVTKGAQTTEIDPVKIRGNDKLSYLLYMINKYDLVNGKAKLTGMEVFYADEQSSGVYGAWTEGVMIEGKSWGGNVEATQSPMTIHWDGKKVHGTFEPKTKTFTATKVV